MGSNDRRPQEARAGKAALLCPCPSDSWQYEVWGGEGKGEAVWVFKLPAALRRKMLLEPRAAIWLVLAIWVQRLQEFGRRCQERREQPQHAVCGLLDTGQVSSGHREATARGLGVSFCEPGSHRVTRQLPWPPRLRKLKAFPYPGWVHAILLECPWAVWVEFLGSSSAQQKCKHRPRGVIKTTESSEAGDLLGVQPRSGLCRQQSPRPPSRQVVPKWRALT